MREVCRADKVPGYKIDALTAKSSEVQLLELLTAVAATFAAGLVGSLISTASPRPLWLAIVAAVLLTVTAILFVFALI